MPLGTDLKSVPKGAKDYELIVKWYLSLFFIFGFSLIVSSIHSTAFFVWFTSTGSAVTSAYTISCSSVTASWALKAGTLVLPLCMKPAAASVRLTLDSSCFPNSCAFLMSASIFSILSCAFSICLGSSSPRLLLPCILSSSLSMFSASLIILCASSFASFSSSFQSPSFLNVSMPLFALTLLPSNATSPSVAIPIDLAITITSVNIFSNASLLFVRNRHRVLKSGFSNPDNHIKAISCISFSSIFLLERVPVAYPQRSAFIIIFEWYAGRPSSFGSLKLFVSILSIISENTLTGWSGLTHSLRLGGRRNIWS